MDHDALALIWFLLLGVLLLGYAILDGFDFGVGMMHGIIPKTDTERRLTMNSIGPIWDGNEVWLITFGGALFAAFPGAYASIFSGFYTALKLLLFMLIFRAVSLEFRSKVQSPRWRGLWDHAFSVSSFGAPMLFGVAVGNVMRGLPMDEQGNFTAGLIYQLNPYALSVGLLTVAAFAMHGTIYLYLKTEGELQQRCVSWMWRTFFIFLALYLFVTGYTFIEVPRATANFDDFPFFWIVVILNVLAVANIPRAIYKGMPGYAFVSSCCTIAAFVFLFAAAIFPHLVPGVDPQSGLTIYGTARSSAKTLGIMLIIALIGMPAVLAYSAVIYWTFRGKVELEEMSY